MPKIKRYEVTASWIMRATVYVEAANKDEAEQLVFNMPDIVSKGEFGKGSFEIEEVTKC